VISCSSIVDEVTISPLDHKEIIRRNLLEKLPLLLVE
jgi:hypothetical protein